MMRWTHLSFSPDELANWVGAVATQLKSTNASPQTLLGAGAGTWEPSEFVRRFAHQKQLDYIDLHLYALKLGPQDQVAKLATAVHEIRQARPEMQVTVGEAWLYKHGADEPKGMLSREDLFSRQLQLLEPSGPAVLQAADRDRTKRENFGCRPIFQPVLFRRLHLWG
jgi:hypothetical protein